MIEWQKPKYQIVRTDSQLKDLACYMEGYRQKGIPLTVDTETVGLTKNSALDPFRCWMLGMSVCVNKYEGFYIPLTHTDADGQLLPNQPSLAGLNDALGPVFERPGTLLGHNLKFDYKILRRSGIQLYPQFWDTMIATKLLLGDSKRSARLKDIITQHSTVPPNLVQTFAEASENNAAMQDPEEFGEYAINDTIFTRIVYEDIKQEIDTKYDKLFYECEMPITPLLAQMELRGIHIDVDYFKTLEGPLGDKIDSLFEKYEKMYGINIGSTSQLGEKMIEVFPKIFQVQRNKKGNLSTAKEVLEALIREQSFLINNPKPEDKAIEDRRLVIELCEEVLVHRRLKKALSTYVKRFPNLAHHHYTKKGTFYVVNTSFTQVQNSGRLSSSPNIQNLSQDTETLSIRKGFISRPGYSFVEGDYGGQELRVTAIVAQEPKMLKAFHENPRDADLHTLTSEGIFGVMKDVEEAKKNRRIAKTLNFAILYGATEYSISITMNCPKDEAKELIEGWFNTYTGVKKWKEDVEQFIVEHGYSETLFGRRRYLSRGLSPDMKEKWKWEGAMRALTNHIIQGTGADLIKFAMVHIAKRLAKAGLDAHIITSTHDSVVVETRNDQIEEVKKIMLDVMEVKIKGILMPVDMEVKTTFAKKKEDDE